MQGVNLAANLNIPRVSIIEFGVAGGNGLVALQSIAKALEQIYKISIEIYGFDTGVGLPCPLDYADMPNLWSEGFFPMDVAKLKRRLDRAKLILGPISETVPTFMKSDIPPVAFVGFDVDLYSSTRDALRLFDVDPGLLLPRIHCVFDDIMGYTFGDHVGERLAISDFNMAHTTIKISRNIWPAILCPSTLRQSYVGEKLHGPCVQSPTVRNPRWLNSTL